MGGARTHRTTKSPQRKVSFLKTFSRFGLPKDSDPPGSSCRFFVGALRPQCNPPDPSLPLAPRPLSFRLRLRDSLPHHFTPGHITCVKKNHLLHSCLVFAMTLYFVEGDCARETMRRGTYSTTQTPKGGTFLPASTIVFVSGGGGGLSPVPHFARRDGSLFTSFPSCPPGHASSRTTQSTRHLTFPPLSLFPHFCSVMSIFKGVLMLAFGVRIVEHWLGVGRWVLWCSPPKWSSTKLFWYRTLICRQFQSQISIAVLRKFRFNQIRDPLGMFSWSGQWAHDSTLWTRRIMV